MLHSISVSPRLSNAGTSQVCCLTSQVQASQRYLLAAKHPNMASTPGFVYSKLPCHYDEEQHYHPAASQQKRSPPGSKNRPKDVDD